MLMRQFVDKLTFFPLTSNMLLHSLMRELLPWKWISSFGFRLLFPHQFIYVIWGTLGREFQDYLFVWHWHLKNIFWKSVFYIFKAILLPLQSQLMDFLFIQRVMKLPTINLLLMASAIIYTKSQNEYQLLQNIRQIEAPKSNSNQRASTLKVLLKVEDGDGRIESATTIGAP